MKKLILGVMMVFLMASMGFTAEKNLTISSDEPVTQTLKVVTMDMLSAEHWKKELTDALNKHIAAAKEVAVVVFPSCKEFSTTLETTMAVNFITTFTVTSQIVCSQPSP